MKQRVFFQFAFVLLLTVGMPARGEVSAQEIQTEANSLNTAITKIVESLKPKEDHVTATVKEILEKLPDSLDSDKKTWKTIILNILKEIRLALKSQKAPLFHFTSSRDNRKLNEKLDFPASDALLQA